MQFAFFLFMNKKGNWPIKLRIINIANKTWSLEDLSSEDDSMTFIEWPLLNNLYCE